MVPENIIDRHVDLLSADDDALERDLELIQHEHPILAAYVLIENSDAFTESERALLLFLFTVILRSVKEHQGTLAKFSADDISAAEEANYEVLDEQSSRVFRERITPFFEQSAEEDLLALLEDAMLDTKEADVTPEGREPLFVTLKTVIDVVI